MVSRVEVAHSAQGTTVPAVVRDPSVLEVDWASDSRNCLLATAPLGAAAVVRPSAVAEDLLDIAAAVYLADIAVPRGIHEEWVRKIEVVVPVRRPDVWQAVRADLIHLLYTLTRDALIVEFTDRKPPDRGWSEPAGIPAAVDCICMLSGGLDSFAGAVSLLRSGRRPLLVSHQSGNPAVATVQEGVVRTLEQLWPGQAVWAPVRIAPDAHSSSARPYPGPDSREPSRRARSFLFMALGAVAAQMAGVSEVFLCENGVLTSALPMSPARIGSLSTRSTHPNAIKLLLEVLERAGLPCTISNPFAHQTKGEVVRTFLKPVLAPAQIAATVSCWSAGRHNRQCGGCVPCLLRRFALLSAGLPDEAYLWDLLSDPAPFRGTEAYGNLMDLLSQAAQFLGHTDVDLLLQYPHFLDLVSAGVDPHDTVKTMRRHAAEVHAVCATRFPRAMQVLEDAIE